MNITAIEDLARPEVVKAMDSDGNGKGEFWIGADGWASANVNQVKLRDYGLYDAGIEPIRAADAQPSAPIQNSPLPLPSLSIALTTSGLPRSSIAVILNFLANF